MNKGLTSFRAFAFFAVFLYHARVLTAGYLGVQAFFVLSGFLLTPILIDMKATLAGRSYFGRFYGRRALRIFPLYYMYLALVTVLCLWIWARANFAPIPAVEGFFRELPWALSYTYNFFFALFPAQTSPLVSHFWSLAIEEQFYLAWPLLLFLTPKSRVKYVLAGLVLLGPLIRYIVVLLSDPVNLPGVGGVVELAVYVSPFSHVDAFAIGGFFALFLRSISEGFVWLAVALVLILGLGTEFYSVGSIRDWSALGYQPLMLDSAKPIWGYSVLNLVFALILVQVRDGRFLRPLLESRVVRYLGEISYGLYVFHFIALGFFMVYAQSVPAVGRILLALGATILASILSYELIEKRFIRMKDRFFARGPKS